MKKDLSSLEQRVSEGQEVQNIEEYQSNSSDRVIVYFEYSFNQFRREVQEEMDTPYLDLELLKKAWKKIPKESIQKACSEVARELLGQYQYEASEEYRRTLRRKQNELKLTSENYKDKE